MAELLLAPAPAPAPFTVIGLPLGESVAFEIIRRQLYRLERLVLMAGFERSDNDATASPLLMAAFERSIWDVVRRNGSWAGVR